MNVQSSIILRLIEQIPDQHLRDQITAQYYHDVEAQTSFVQTRISELEIHLEDTVRDQLGITNEMIGENVKTSHENAAALASIHATIEELRKAAQAGFLDLDKRMTDSERDRAVIHERLERIEQIIDGRPEQVQLFYQLIDRVARLEQAEQRSNEP